MPMQNDLFYSILQKLQETNPVRIRTKTVRKRTALTSKQDTEGFIRS